MLHLLRNSEMSFIFSKSHKNISYWNNVKIKEGLYYSAWSRPLKGFDIFFIFLSFFRKKKNIYIYNITYTSTHAYSTPDPLCVQSNIRCFYFRSSQREINYWIIIKNLQLVSFTEETALWQETLKYFLVIHTHFIYSLLFIYIYSFTQVNIY